MPKVFLDPKPVIDLLNKLTIESSLPVVATGRSEVPGTPGEPAGAGANDAAATSTPAGEPVVAPTSSPETEDPALLAMRSVMSAAIERKPDSWLQPDTAAVAKAWLKTQNVEPGFNAEGEVIIRLPDGEERVVSDFNGTGQGEGPFTGVLPPVLVKPFGKFTAPEGYKGYWSDDQTRGIRPVSGSVDPLSYLNDQRQFEAHQAEVLAAVLGKGKK